MGESKQMRIALEDEEATFSLGKGFADAISKLKQPLLVIYLNGDLGAGKTTLVRAILRGLGVTGSVKSPTYTLVEEYEVAATKIYHFDLYRLADPEELEFMGIRDFLNPELEEADKTVCFVEWPERGVGLIPPADIVLELSIQGTGRTCAISGAEDCMQELSFIFEV